MLGHLIRPDYQYLQKDQTLAIQVDYSVTDEEGASDTNSFTITLTGTNDLPELTGVASTLPGGTEDQDYEITKLQLLAGYTDIDLGETGSLKVINLVAKDDSGNNLLKDDGTSRFTPDDLADPTKWTFDVPANFNGNVNVTYEIEDIKGGKIQSSTRFNLGAVNDAPIKVTADVHTFANETEDIAFTITETDLLAGYNDEADGETNDLEVVGLSVTNGVITTRRVRMIIFSSNPDFNGPVTLSYVVSDTKGGTYVLGTLIIDAVNDEPVRTAGNVGTLFLVEDEL